jgi:hypothetical protein
MNEARMHARTSTLRATLLVAGLTLTGAAQAGAQAFAYPAFQAPRVVSREYNFGLADADGATSLLFQWREGSGARSQLSLDIGFADTNNDGVFFIGGQFANQLATSTASMPFDLLLTVGAGLSRLDFGDESRNALRIPVGVSAGHVFPLEGGSTITPFIHPRLVFASCNDCFFDNNGDADDSNIGLEFDVGGEFKFSPAFALRLAASLGDDDILNGDSFGVSLAWTPGRVSRSRR